MARKTTPPAEKLVPISGRVTAKAKCRLDALAQVKEMTVYGLVEEAFWAYWEELPEKERSAADAIVQALESVRK